MSPILGTENRILLVLRRHGRCCGRSEFGDARRSPGEISTCDRLSKGRQLSSPNGDRDGSGPSCHWRIVPGATPIWPAFVTGPPRGAAPLILFSSAFLHSPASTPSWPWPVLTGRSCVMKAFTVGLPPLKWEPTRNRHSIEYEHSFVRAARWHFPGPLFWLFISMWIIGASAVRKKNVVGPSSWHCWSPG